MMPTHSAPTPIAASAVMLVKNSERYLAQVLTALSCFDEVLLLDNGSTDNTLTIASRFPNVAIHHHDFIGFGDLKNLAASLAKHDWIFSIDSDEIPDATLLAAIKQALSTAQTQQVFTVSRLNHYRGRPIKGCGWYPDIIPRLYHRHHTQFNRRRVHESLERPNGTILIPLAGELKHYSYDNAEALLTKMQHYTTLFAEQSRYHRRASTAQAWLHGIAAFVKSYFIRNGWRYGSDGLTISTANAQGSYYKYIKLNEHNQALPVSLIITTYNRPDALNLVLQSAAAQNIMPSEIIIADDGSGSDTADLIHRFAATSPVPVKHVWQEGNGFHTATSRNRALAAASCDYVVLIDGDMVLHPEFIADHITAARPRQLVQGSRVLLSEQFTAHWLSHPPSFPLHLSAFNHGVVKKHAAIRCPFLARLISRRQSQAFKAIKSCNMGFFRQDALAINGFNNDFIGWGREDSEFVARCYHSGMTRSDLKFAGLAYHLWHHEAERSSLPANDLLLQRTLDEKIIRCEHGVDAFLPQQHSSDPA